jgi:SAM-dependent methyltransferase
VITIDFNRLGIQNGTNILDIGCGSGRHIGAAVRYQKTFTVGTDLAPGNLKETAHRLMFQEKSGEGGGAWGLCASDITCLPFADQSFDAVICAEVLEHIPDEKAAAEELFRVLKPGRILAVSVPRFFPEWICWQISREYRTAENGHIRIYQKKSLMDLMQNNGFILKSCHYAHSLHTPYWWLKCLVGPSREDSFPVNLYHRFLTWDIFYKPRMIRLLDRLLNPIMGKSLALYFQKSGSPTRVQ